MEAKANIGARAIFRLTFAAKWFIFAIMKPALTPEEQRQWMEQWREAAIYLDEVKRDELANMTDQEGWRAIESVLSPAPRYRRLSRTSGLVKQQALFAKLRK
jgi:hypothetical protein